ncbi:MAG: hypothetical protein LBB94_10985 [Clostridiales bacterium]|jgi:hypothetical protein|nr:hypothetical protein [Clostridiales bacterium]
MFNASAYASFLTIITAVFILITAQLAITSAELRVSRMNERYSALYDIGVSAAEAEVKGINSAIRDAETEILREYMDTYDWAGQCVLSDGALTLDGEVFRQSYGDIAAKYLSAPRNLPVTIFHESSGMEILIESNYGAPGSSFAITVTNNGARPAVKNITGIVKIEGKIIWNPAPQIYSLTPLFDMDTEALEGKTADNFIVRRVSDHKPVILSEVHRV